MKTVIAIATLLASALPASAQIFSFSGEFSISLEGGLTTAVNTSTASLLVENNAGAGAPWVGTELVPASVLGFGLGGSFGAEANIGLSNGNSIYLRSSGNLASGTTDISRLFSVDAAFPGLHDDGFLLQNTWESSVTIDTRSVDTSIGVQSAASGSVSFFAGVLFGEVAQDFTSNYDFDLATAEGITVSGASTNSMVGAELGIRMTQAISDKLQLNIFGAFAALSNSFQYTYTYQNDEPFGSTVTASATGTSTVLRSEISAQLAYAQSKKISYTGKVGIVGYSNVSTGLENTLNPNNTLASITPVFNTVVVPYVRAGIRIAF